MKNKALLGALAGAIAGILSWLISLPFLPYKEVTSVADVAQVVEDPATGFTLGTFYGWFSSSLLGLLAGLLITCIYTWNRDPRHRLRSCVIGAVLGAILVCSADAFSDYIGIAIIRSFGDDLSTDLLTKVIWSVLISTALCSAIVYAMKMHKEVVSRLFLAILLSSVAAVVLRYVADNGVSMVEEFIVSQGKALNSWALSAPGFLASDIVTATTVGALLAVAEFMTRPAWLRLILGKNEGYTWTLDRQNIRIGSQEGLEVRVPYDPAIAPVHASIQRQNSNYLLVDLDSKTGVLVNGQPIRSSWLKDKDLIQLGPYVFEFNLKRSPTGSKE